MGPGLGWAEGWGQRVLGPGREWARVRLRVGRATSLVKREPALTKTLTLTLTLTP